MKNFGNSDIKALLFQFKEHLTCWKVGLSIGSMLYFEMGKRLTTRLDSGEPVEIGSTTLVLEADEWTITGKGKPIINSDSIMQDEIYNILSQKFIEEKLISIQFHSKTKECHILFSHDLDIRLKGEAEEDICMLTFPDGTIIACNTGNGFYSDGSRSEPHMAAYSQN